MEIDIKKMKEVLGDGARIIHHKDNKNRKPSRKVSSFLKPREEYSQKTIYNACKKKAAYSSRARAIRFAKKCEAERGVYIRVYECPHCHKYHLTHKSNKNFKTSV